MLADMFLLLKNASITLPMIELVLCMAALSVFLVLRLTRIGLITAYLFVYRWGLLFFMRDASHYLMFYLIFGFVIGIITVISMVLSPPASE